jgi:hypothetical protein
LRTRGRLLIALAALAAAAGSIRLAPSGPDWIETAPREVRISGRFADSRVTESSGVVRGRVNPDVLWTLNDSGNDPLLFAFDTTGASRGTLLIDGATNADWEAIGAGPCGDGWCLYIGDIGNNRGIRREITVYRVVEPALGADTALRVVSVLDRLVGRYPAAPEDAEAMVVSEQGEVDLITKGRERRVDVYRMPAGRASEPVTLEPGPRLGIPVAFLLGRLVTDAALSPDRSTLAVRTYRTIYLFGRGSASAGLPTRPLLACSIDGLDPIGEGITWWDDSTLVLTSERGLRRSPAPITLLRCPLP